MNRARNQGKICVSVCAETADQMIEKIGRAERFADVIEVRFDCLKPAEIVNFKSQLSDRKLEKPLIATLRSPDQGGRRDLVREERSEFWSRPIPGFWAADGEEDVVGSAQGWPFRIVSFHDLTGSPPALAPVIARLSGAQPDAIKIAVRVHDVVETVGMWELLAQSSDTERSLIAIAMGEAGKLTRILGPAHGAFMTYASLDEGDETAEGQLTARDLSDVYRVKSLDRETRVYGVIGDPVSESLSPYIHNAAFVDAGVNAVFVPLLVKDLDAFFERMVLPATREVELNFAGFAVTMPHKQAVMKYLDKIDITAEHIGAVNTIKIEHDKLIGYNTDEHGFITALEANYANLAGARVAILGAGGAARACASGLKPRDAKVTIFGRDNKKAEAVASHIGAVPEVISNLKFEISNYDILINATPLGMKGELEDLSPLTAEDLKGVKLVFDLVTRPGDTPLVREAKRAGVAVVTGLEMLIEQALKQFEIWTGREAPRDVMRSAAIARMERTE